LLLRSVAHSHRYVALRVVSSVHALLTAH
jgi:hypothetical protein